MTKKKITSFKILTSYLGTKPILIFVTITIALLHLIWFAQTSRDLLVKGLSTDFTATEIISQTNQARTKNGLSILKENQMLSNAASKKALNMIETGNFDHYYTGENNLQTNPWQFIIEQNYQYLHAGENLARGFQSAENTVQAWIDSPPHKANLLNTNYTQTGVAVIDGEFQDSQTTLVVQLFATPLTSQNQLQLLNSDPKDVAITPILTRPQSLLGNLRTSYPISLGLGSLVLISVSVLSYIINNTNPKKTKARRPSNELWRH